jgi:AcrR family transcriptional regulator
MNKKLRKLVLFRKFFILLPLQKQKEMTLQEKIILEIGKQLSIKGCKAITMEEIAQNVGISKRTLYENFADKESLIGQCLLFYINKTIEATNKMVDEADNSLDAILKIIYNKSKFAGKFGYATIADIQKYYPNIFNSAFARRSWDEEKHDSKLLFGKAIKEGFIVGNISIDFMLNMLELNVHNAMKDDYLEKNSFYTQRVIALLHILILLRGVATIKGIEFIDNFSSKIGDFSHFEISNNE